MKQRRLGWARVLLLLALGPGLGLWADEDGSDVSLPLASVRVEPAGHAAEALDRVLEALAESSFPPARDALNELRTDHGRALVPVPPAAGAAEAGPLYWPVPRVVETLFVRLPPEERERLAREWSGRTRPLERRAQGGDLAALRQLADDWAPVPAGRRALRLLAGRALESGRFEEAADRLGRWLTVAVDAPPVLSAEVRRMLSDARRSLKNGRRRDRSPPMTGRLLPQDPVVVWSRTWEPEGHLGKGHQPPSNTPPRVGAVADREDLFLHDGRYLSRMDVWTGRAVWRFPPPDPGGPVVAPNRRYRSFALPLHQPALAPRIVVAVLGNPVARGRYEVSGVAYRPSRETRATRTRLVAVDRDQGTLLWTTGRATDTHPVLSDAATGCASPPLVVDGRVYALFARVRVAIEHYLVCFDVETGRVEWASFLATGESGREGEAEGGRVFAREYARAAPWGARPTLHEGELCVLAHAGFAAGVDASDGRVRWVRALPRYARSLGLDPIDGQGGRNVPLPWAGQWVLAAHDAPLLILLESRSGRWRHSAPVPTPDDPVVIPPWRHVYGVGEGPAGEALVRGSGTVPHLVSFGDAASMREVPEHAASVPTILEPGRPLDVATHLVWAAGEERGPSDPLPRTGLFAVPWETGAGPSPSPGAERAVPAESGLPSVGVVVRAGDVWIVLGERGAGAIADRQAARRWSEACLGDADASAGKRSAALSLAARLDIDAEGVARSFSEARRARDEGARAVALDAARAVLAEQPGAALGALGEALMGDGGGEAGTLLFRALERIDASAEPDRLVTVLDRWVGVGADTLVEVEAGVRIRADLLAATRLRRLRHEPTATPALEARDRRWRQALEAGVPSLPHDLREAVRRAAATPAAAAFRERLVDRLGADGRWAEAAAAAADLRLDPTGRPPEAEAARERTAALQVAEIGWLARAGQSDRATRLLADLERWAKLGTWRSAEARVASAPGATAAWVPKPGAPRRLDVWGAAVPASAEVRGVVVPGLEGPGAGIARDHLLLAQGLDLETWSISGRRRVATFPDAGRGWFGGSLQETDPWVPDRGVIASSLLAGEPADRSGLRAGDWIVSFDGEPIRGASHFMNRIARAVPGRVIALEALRRGSAVGEFFEPGSRPPREGVVVARETLWSAADGRILVPGRLDLSWVDTEAGTKRSLWRWNGTGVVSHVRVRQGQAVVSVRRSGEADTLVAVDLTSGEERWRRDVAGSAVRTSATGSALLITTREPARIYVLDAYDGRIRMHADRLTRRPLRRSFALVGAPTAVSLHGHVWWLRSVRGQLLLRAANTTTAETTWTEPSSFEADDFGPLLAADAVLAVTHGPLALEVLAPDPLTGAPAWRSLYEQDPERGPFIEFGAESRLLLSRWTLWVLNPSYERTVRADVFEIRPEVLGPRNRRRGGVPGKLAYRRFTGRDLGPSRESGSSDAYLLDARAFPHGLVVSSARVSGRRRRETTWLGRDGAARWLGEHSGARQGWLQIYRYPPSRFGKYLVLPGDRGPNLVDLESVSAR